MALKPQQLADNDDNPWLRVDTVADIAGVTTQTVRLWIKRGLVEAHRFGYTSRGQAPWRIRRSALRDFMENRNRPTALQEDAMRLRESDRAVMGAPHMQPGMWMRKDEFFARSYGKFNDDNLDHYIRLFHFTTTQDKYASPQPHGDDRGYINRAQAEQILKQMDNFNAQRTTSSSTTRPPLEIDGRVYSTPEDIARIDALLRENDEDLKRDQARWAKTGIYPGSPEHAAQFLQAPRKPGRPVGTGNQPHNEDRRTPQHALSAPTPLRGVSAPSSAGLHFTPEEQAEQARLTVELLASPDPDPADYAREEDLP